MRVNLHPGASRSAGSTRAGRIVESCVHCGLCSAACPTYELLDHELDSPRGRIYLIRAMLEGGQVSARTREHLDRCLGCRACEPACPSGVAYGELIDLGRAELDRRLPRKPTMRLARWALRRFVQSPRLFGSALALARLARPALPSRWRHVVPARPTRLPRPASTHARSVLSLTGCVHRSLAPQHDDALALVLDQFQVSLLKPDGSGCCGAIDHHQGAEHDALAQMRRNIDAWWPLVEGGAEAIVLSSSGCGALVRQYGELLKSDSRYAGKAARIARLLMDPVELIGRLWQEKPLELSPLTREDANISFHAPCSLQHGQRLGGQVERLLAQAGYHLNPVAESHMCCGSAGTYSILQPALADRLRERKLAHLLRGQPALVASANVGCIAHLQARSAVPVVHWLELLAARLLPTATRAPV